MISCNRLILNRLSNKIFSKLEGKIVVNIQSIYPTAASMERDFLGSLPVPCISRTGKRLFSLKEGKTAKMRELVKQIETFSKKKETSVEDVYKVSSYLIWADMKGKYLLRYQGTLLQKIGNCIRRFFSFSKESHFSCLYKAIIRTCGLRGALLSKDMLEDLKKIQKEINSSPAAKLMESHMLNAVINQQFPKNPKDLEGYGMIEKLGKDILKIVELLYLSPRRELAVDAIRRFTVLLPILSFYLVHFSDLKEFNRGVVDLLKVSQAHNAWVSFFDGKTPLRVLPINAVYGKI